MLDDDVNLDECVRRHAVRVDVLWREVGDQYWRLRRLAHGQRHGQLENKAGSCRVCPVRVDGTGHTGPSEFGRH